MQSLAWKQAVPSFALAGLIFSTAIAGAQISTRIMQGRAEAPVLGLPYTADETIHTVQHLGNGLVVTRDVKGRIARNADGVERFEGTFPSTDPAHPEATTMATIIDRFNHTSVTLNDIRKTAVRQTLPAVATISVEVLPLQASSTQPIKAENLTTTDLGKKTLGIMSITGRLVSGDIPIGKLGNDQPLSISTEVWVSPELKIIVKQVEKNPQFGERTFELSNVRGEEPDPALFQIPDGYAVTDRPAMSPPPGLGAAPKTAATPSAPEQRTKQIEDALNNPDPVVKNSVAFALANNRDHLADAQLLTQQAVLLKEQQVADAVSSADPDKAFDQMVGLSRFWDTAGYVFYRAGRPERAEPYLRAAWELNPNSQFAIHLGLDYETQHKTQLAILIYRMALAAHPSPTIQDALMTCLNRLGASDATPLPVQVGNTLTGLNVNPAGEPPTFDVVLKSGQTPAITWLKGDKATRKPIADAVQSALAAVLPDNGPELVIRRAEVICNGVECSLHYINTREFTAAELALRNAHH